MKAARDATIFIDLSFLSPEEEELIQKVLLRDENLKKKEIGRVRKLRDSVPDPKQLKELSGEWFEDLKSERYGRQPHASAVVRSSMRWKKSGHRQNPFLKSLSEENDGEKDKTRPNVSSDPRSIHPALGVQVQQENKEEVMLLEAVHPSGDKLQHQPSPVKSLKLEPVQESKTQKATITKEINTKISDPGRRELNEDQRVNIGVETRLKQTDGNTSKQFEIRSFDQALQTSNWEICQVGSDQESNKAQSLKANVAIDPNNRTSTEVTNKHNNPTPEILINSGIGFKNEIRSPIPKKRSGEGNRVMQINNEKTIKTKKNELSADLNAKEDPGLFEDLKTRPVNNVNTLEHDNLDQTLDPVQKGKERAAGEIIVTNFKRSAATTTKELSVDFDVKSDPDLLEGPVNNVNAAKHGNLDQILDPVQKRKEQAVEEIMVTDFKQICPNRIEEKNIDFKVDKDLDILEGPVNNVNKQKSVNWDQNSFDPVQKGKQRAAEEIIITDFKPRSQTSNEKLDVEKNPDFYLGPAEEIMVTDFKPRSKAKMEELRPELNANANLDLNKDLKHESVHADFDKNENRLEELPGSVMKNGKNEAGGKRDFDVEPRESESSDQNISVEIEEISEPEQEDENGISESSILSSVYARATKPKSDVSKTTFTEEPMQKAVEVIPTIVIVPSETEEPKEMERVKKETPDPEALAEVAKSGTDTWEDEGMDSDEDSSSSSSHDSDISGKKGQLSASTLSVTERTASLLSVYSDAGDFGNVTVQGSVEFAIMYSPLGELVIMVEQCQDLAIANTRKQRTDPYVKTYLYPDKRSKRKTSIKKRTVNPVYVESLRYKVKRESLHGRILNLSVWHNDSRGRNAFLGQVELQLKDWDWKHEALTWYNLQPKNADNQDSQEFRGVLCMSLKYVPEATGGSRLGHPMGEIHIWLREAKHLPRLKVQGVNSFVKCYMLPDTSKKSRQKTRVVKNAQDPVYNHNMVYDGFRAGEVCEACCELTVWDNNKLSNQFLGGVRLSLGTGQSYGKKVDWMDSENEEVEIWKKIMDNPNSWVEAELPLRSSMTPRK